MGTLEEFRSIGNDLLVTLDGTEYYRSERINCPQCHVSHHSNAKVSYKHMLITPVIGTSPTNGLNPRLSPSITSRQPRSVPTLAPLSK